MRGVDARYRLRREPARVLLHDTRTGEIRRLEPANPPKVRIYACGPTVYGRVHVGNARPFVVFSQLKRFLNAVGTRPSWSPTSPISTTRSTRRRRPPASRATQLAVEMTAAYVGETDRFGLGRPDHEPLASETIGPIIALIERLIEGGNAYAADGDVYFSVRSYGDYGELSHRDVDQMDQGEGSRGPLQA